MMHKRREGGNDLRAAEPADDQPLTAVSRLMHLQGMRGPNGPVARPLRHALQDH
jgi:hypothetical protein